MTWAAREERAPVADEKKNCMPFAKERLKSGARVDLGLEPLLRERSGSIDEKIPRPAGLPMKQGAGVEAGARIKIRRTSQSPGPAPTLHMRRTMLLTFG